MAAFDKTFVETLEEEKKYSPGTVTHAAVYFVCTSVC